LYREQIKKEPAFYIGNFVKLEAQSSSPEWNSITCEPFYNQIFEDKNNVKAYIDQCLTNRIKGADTASNFWELYAANNYKSIEFYDQGVVQEKIKDGLKKELSMLRQLQEIQNKISMIPNDSSELSDEQNNHLNQMLKELEKIQLNISLKDQLKKQIKELLS